MSSWLIGLELFFFGFFLSLLLVPVAKKISLRWNIVDKPGERKMHHKSKALLGGLGIYLAFLITIIVHICFFLLRQHIPFISELLKSHSGMLLYFDTASIRLIALLCGSLIIVVLGFFDDRKGAKFPASIKFLGQILAAGIVVFGGIVTNFMPGTVLDIVLTIFWIVGITNSFNLLDNMDGLSAGLATIVSIILFIITISQGQVFTGFVLAIFVGCVSGFLPYNLYPSKIFMGDTGSTFLGFFLGCITVISSYITPESPTYLPVIIPIIILAVPLFDTFSVLIIRWRQKKPLFVGDKNHFSHRLVKLGMRQSEAVVFIYIVTLAVGIMALLLPKASWWESIVILIQTILFFTLISFLMFVAKSREKR